MDDYVRTAHYLDQSLEQFFHYLQTTSLYNHSILLFMVTTSVFQMRTTRTYVKLSTAIQKRGQTMTMRNCKEYLDVLHARLYARENHARIWWGN